MNKEKILELVKEEFDLAYPSLTPSEYRVFIFYMIKHGRHLFYDTWIKSDAVSELIKDKKLRCEGQHFHQGEKCIRYSFIGYKYPVKYYRSIPKQLKQSVMDRDDNSCVKCNAYYRLSIDHIYPWSLNGWTELHNLQVLCVKCNSEKSNKY